MKKPNTNTSKNNNIFTHKKRKSYRHGIWAEFVSCWYLRLKGYKIINRRYKNHYGEIDIIAKKVEVICFVEVKFRQNFRSALESINQYKKNRIIKSALYWQAQHFYAQDMDLRFDVIALSPYKLPLHIKNAFIANKRF